MAKGLDGRYQGPAGLSSCSGTRGPIWQKMLEAVSKPLRKLDKFGKNLGFETASTELAQVWEWRRQRDRPWRPGNVWQPHQ